MGYAGIKSVQPIKISPLGLIHTEEGKIDIDLKDIAFIRTTEQMTSKDAKSLREEFQYGTETTVNEKLLRELLENAKKVVEKIEIALNEL